MARYPILIRATTGSPEIYSDRNEFSPSGTFPGVVAGQTVIADGYLDAGTKVVWQEFGYPNGSYVNGVGPLPGKPDHVSLNNPWRGPSGSFIVNFDASGNTGIVPPGAVPTPGELFPGLAVSEKRGGGLFGGLFGGGGNGGMLETILSMKLFSGGFFGGRKRRK